MGTIKTDCKVFVEDMAVIGRDNQLNMSVLCKIQEILILNQKLSSSNMFLNDRYNDYKWHIKQYWGMGISVKKRIWDACNYVRAKKRTQPIGDFWLKPECGQFNRRWTKLN